MQIRIGLCIGFLLVVVISSEPLSAQEAKEDVPERDQSVDGVAVELEDESAPEQSVDRMVVSGTRIRRADLEESSPVSIVESERMKAVGTVNVEEFLRDLPQFAPAQGSNITSRNAGAATLDLRNLGENRTLVLVDGKRFVPFSSDGIVDVNTIPSALLERVEIVTGGASSVYGSDAIAGVVNFILDKDFKGLQLDAQYGSTQENDGDRAQFSLSAGTGLDNDRGNVIFNLEWTDVDKIRATERDFSSVGLGNDLLPDFSSFDVDGRVGNFGFTPDGRIEPAVSDFDFLPFTFIQVPQTRWTATALFSYDLTSNIEAYSRFSFIDSETDTVRGPTATFGFAPVDLNINSPFLDQSATERLLDTFGDPDEDGIITLPEFRRRLPELGPRAVNFDNSTFQFVAGLSGELPNEMYWDLFAQKGETDRQAEFNNDVDKARLQQAILAERVGNSVVCIDQSQGCVPANVFGRGNLSQEAADFISIDLSVTEVTEQIVSGASLGGDLPFRLPSADSSPAWVVGVEYREEENSTRPDASFQDNRATGFGSVSPLEATIEIIEGFAELKAPIISDLALADSVSIELGVRYADYSNNVNFETGKTSNDISNIAVKFGGDWRINESLRLRGLYQRAVRAPNLAEIGAPRSLTPFGGFASFDPCAGSAPLEDPNLRELCIATGAPVDAIGSVPEPSSNEINAITGGNPFLDEETSDTLTFGFVYTPIDRLNIIVDYYDIEIEDAVTAVSESVILDSCFNQGQIGFCDRVQRNPRDGSLFGGRDTGGVDISLINAAEIEVRGFDVAANYGLDLHQFGDIGLNLALTHVRETSRRDFPTAERVDCAGLVGNICARPVHEVKFLQSTEWQRGPFSLLLRWQFLSEIDQDAIELRGVDPAEFAVETIPSEHYFDLTGSYQIREGLSMRAGILNLFDTAPPIVGNNFGVGGPNEMNTFPAVYDPVGRRFFLGLNSSF